MNLLILCFHFINMIRAGSARWCPAFDGRSYISDQKRNYLAADKVPRASKGAARFFVGGILWRFCFIFFRIFCFVYLRQYLNKNIYRFTSDTNQTPDVGALRCAGGGVGADYRLPVPRTTDNDTVLRFAVETYSPRVDRFHRCLLSVHLLLTCFRFFDFIYQKKIV